MTTRDDDNVTDETLLDLVRSGALSRRTFLAVTGSAALAAALAACGGDNSGSSSTTATSAGAGGAATTAPAAAGSTAAPKSGGTLRVMQGVNPTTLDPHAGSSGGDYVMLYPIFDTLVDFDPQTLEPKPGLAESWTFDTPTSLTIKLRPGLLFQDGTPLNADAVKFNLTRAQTGEKSNIKPDLAVVTAMDVVDDTTIRLTLSQPSSELVGILSDRAGMMLSPTAVQALGDAGIATKPVGAGPFKLVEWKPGEVVTYARSEHYWQPGLPYLDGMNIQIVQEPDTQLNAFLSAGTDVILSIDPQSRSQVDGNSDLRIIEYVGIGVCKVMYFNTTQPPFDDKLVRQAVNRAINREELADAATFGTGEPMWMYFPKSHWAYIDSTVPTYQFDAAAAKKLLADAGHPDGITFDMVHQPDATDSRAAEILQAQLKEAGITMNLVPVELAQSVTDYFVDGKYPAGHFGWSGRPDPNMTYRQIYGAKAYFNAGKHVIPGFDDLTTQASSVSAIADRQAVYTKLVPLVSDEAIMAPLFWRATLSGATSNVDGFVPNLLGKPKFTSTSISS
jgi:ABC-type transport system substrate-binding protein